MMSEHPLLPNYTIMNLRYHWITYPPKYKRTKNELVNYYTHPAFYTITAGVSTITQGTCR